MSKHDSKKGLAFAASPKCACVARSKRRLLPWKQNLTDVMGNACVDSNGRELKALPEPASLRVEKAWQKNALAHSICPCVAAGWGLLGQQDPAPEADKLWVKAKDLWENGMSLWADGEEDGGEVCKSETECPPPPPPGLVWGVSSELVLYPVRAQCACMVQASQPSRVAA
ncbi:hypothetical protein NR798_05305 [Archangium gephyra]|uniref:hypothetical protein n=1 Tax=Archangium gephyra TaxID=48 RepID=UPI0035D4EA95